MWERCAPRGSKGLLVEISLGKKGGSANVLLVFGGKEGVWGNFGLVIFDGVFRTVMLCRLTWILLDHLFSRKEKSIMTVFGVQYHRRCILKRICLNQKTESY